MCLLLPAMYYLVPDHILGPVSYKQTPYYLKNVRQVLLCSRHQFEHCARKPRLTSLAYHDLPSNWITFYTDDQFNDLKCFYQNWQLINLFHCSKVMVYRYSLIKPLGKDHPLDSVYMYTFSFKQKLRPGDARLYVFRTNVVAKQSSICKPLSALKYSKKQVQDTTSKAEPPPADMSSSTCSSSASCSSTSSSSYGSSFRSCHSSSDKRYCLKGFIREEVAGRPPVTGDSGHAALYGVQFNPFLQMCGQLIFATVGSNRAAVYECEPGGGIRLKQAYVDSERDENYYCCVWTYHVSPEQKGVAGNPLLVVGGARGVIRVIDTTTRDVHQELKGHGSSINDLKIHPKDVRLLMSASRDHSIRLWNIATQTCVAILGGLEGHRDEVLSIDFHITGSHLVSSGMDHALKIWSLKSDKLQKSIQDSFAFDQRKSRYPFKTAKNQFPAFTTRNVHRNYVDSVSWYGNCVLSKSCENSIVLWKPGQLDMPLENALSTGSSSSDQTASVLHKFECDHNEIWFIRFGMDEMQQVLAVGNQMGDIYVWSIHDSDPTHSRRTVLSHSTCTKPIRQVCFSLDGSILLAVSDDSTIWRWDYE